MVIQWSDFALQSLEDIIIWYEVEAGRNVADSIEGRIFPYVAFIRPIAVDMWEVVDIVHTSRKLPKSE